MRYAQIEAMRPEYPVSLMCRVLSMSESGYHAWRGRPPVSEGSGSSATGTGGEGRPCPDERDLWS